MAATMPVTLRIDKEHVETLRQLAREHSAKHGEDRSAADIIRGLVAAHVKKAKKAQKPITTIDAPQKYATVTAAEAAAYRREQLVHDDYDLSTASDNIANYFANQ